MREFHWRMVYSVNGTAAYGPMVAKSPHSLTCIAWRRLTTHDAAWRHVFRHSTPKPLSFAKVAFTHRCCFQVMNWSYAGTCFRNGCEIWPCLGVISSAYYCREKQLVHARFPFPFNSQRARVPTVPTAQAYDNDWYRRCYPPEASSSICLSQDK